MQLCASQTERVKERRIKKKEKEEINKTGLEAYGTFDFGEGLRLHEATHDEVVNGSESSAGIEDGDP